MNRQSRLVTARILRAAAAKLKAAAKIVKKGNVGPDGVWEGEVVSDQLALTDILGRHRRRPYGQDDGRRHGRFRLRLHTGA